jgi:hypothetical protein
MTFYFWIRLKFKKDKPSKFHRSVKDFLKMIIINETEGHPILGGHLNLDFGSSANSYYPFSQKLLILNFFRNEPLVEPVISQTIE